MESGSGTYRPTDQIKTGYEYAGHSYPQVGPLLTLTYERV